MESTSDSNSISSSKKTTGSIKEISDKLDMKFGVGLPALLLNAGMTTVGVATAQDAEDVIGAGVASIGDLALDMGARQARLTADAGMVNKQFAFGVFEKAKFKDKTISKNIVKNIRKFKGKYVSTASKLLAKSTSAVGRAGARLSATAAALAPSGPIGWLIEAALLVMQLGAMVIDMTWNPLQAYFNKDIKNMKDQIDANIRKQFITNYNADWPLEVKPNIIPWMEEDLKKYIKYRQEYLDNNGLISAEEVLEEEILYGYLLQLKRKRDIVQNPFNRNINLLSATRDNVNLIVAAAIIRRHQQLMKTKNLDYNTYKPRQINKVTHFLQHNWQLIICMCLLICSCILFSISILTTV